MDDDRFKAWVTTQENPREILVALGFHPKTVQAVLAGRYKPGRKMLKALGLVSVPPPPGASYETLEEFLGAVPDPEAEIVRILGCSPRHAMGIIRGVKVPPQSLLDALGIKSVKRTIGTPPKAVLLARSRYLQKIGREMVEEMEAALGETESTRRWKETLSGWGESSWKG